MSGELNRGGEGMTDLFADYNQSSIWYHPIADRLFIFHKASFWMLPCLEREDGIKLIISEPKTMAPQLEYIGEL